MNVNVNPKQIVVLTEDIAQAVTDPGFPVGGRRPRRGAPTPEAATF